MSTTQSTERQFNTTPWITITDKMTPAEALAVRMSVINGGYSVADKMKVSREFIDAGFIMSAALVATAATPAPTPTLTSKENSTMNTHAVIRNESQQPMYTLNSEALNAAFAVDLKAIGDTSEGKASRAVTKLELATALHALVASIAVVSSDVSVTAPTAEANVAESTAVPFADDAHSQTVRAFIVVYKDVESLWSADASSHELLVRYSTHARTHGPKHTLTARMHAIVATKFKALSAEQVALCRVYATAKHWITAAS